jgi:hypothetical protein
MFKTEDNENLCGSCKLKSRVIRTIFYNLPKYLIIHLNWTSNKIKLIISK